MNDRSLKIGLIVSIILNVFLIGGIAGGMAFWRLNPPTSVAAPAAAAGTQPRRPLRFAADGLAPQQQRAFRQALRQARQDTLPQLRQAQAHRRDLVGLIGAETFDRPAVEAALAGARTADGAVRARVEAAVVNFAGTLDADERGVFMRGLPWTPAARPAAGRRNNQSPATENQGPAR